MHADSNETITKQYHTTTTSQQPTATATHQHKNSKSANDRQQHKQ